MAHSQNSPEEQFADAAKDWDLPRLYKDLASAKRQVAPHKKKELTEVEKLHLRGLLCGYHPAEIAEKLHKNYEGVRADLSQTVYCYVKQLTEPLAKKVINWRNISDWLENAGYKIQAFNSVERQGERGKINTPVSQIENVSSSVNSSDDDLNRLVLMVCSSPAAWENLLSNLTNPIYRQFFLLTIQSVPNANKIHLLESMKRRVDKIVDEPYLQELLTWVSLKASQVTTSYKSAVIRAFYLQFSPSSSPPFVDLASILADGNFTFNFEASLSVDVCLLRTLHCALDVARLCSQVGTLPSSILKFKHERTNNLINALQDACVNADVVGFELQQSLQKLKSLVPELDNEDKFNEWWKIKGKAWIENLSKEMREHRDIGHNWQFNSHQSGALLKYCTANKLLINCLKSASSEVRSHIEDTLLLPIAEIEQHNRLR